MCAITFLLTVTMTLSGCAKTTEDKYNDAQELLVAGKYEKAAEIFQEISGYLDANQFVMYSRA